jgi:hypothetical protein
LPSFDKVVQTGISPNRVGAANMQGLTFMDYGDPPQDHIPPDVEGRPEDSGAGGNPVMFLIGFILILALLWLARHNSGHLKAEAFGINLFNLLVITITAIVGIVLFKVIFTRFPIPGLTPLIAAV